MNFLHKTIDITKKDRLWFLSFAVLLAFVYDFLFWDKSLGINFTVFVLVYLIGFLFLCHKRKLLVQKKALWLILPILIMTVDTQIYSNTLVQYFVPLFVLIQLFILTGWLPAKNPSNVLFAIHKIPLLRYFNKAIAQWSSIIKDLSSSDDTGTRGVVRRVFVGVALALPILFLFGALFYSADQVFADLINKINIESTDLWRVVRTIGLSLLFGGIFYEVFSQNYSFIQSKSIKEIKESDSLIVSVILILINALFATFVFIQFKYLFGNATYISENNLTYAEYARKGFFELLVVSAFATVITLAVYRTYKKIKETTVLYTATILLLIQTGIIASSALTRLNLYQDAYSFTVLRLYTEWFIVFLFGIFIVIGYGVISNMEFRKNFIILWIYGILSLTLVVSLNVDSVIAQKNIDRFVFKINNEDITEVNVDIFDSSYITHLGADVIPALVKLKQQPELFARLLPYQRYEITGAINFDTNLDGATDINGMLIGSPDWQEYHAGRKYIYNKYTKVSSNREDNEYQFAIIDRYLQNNVSWTYHNYSDSDNLCETKYLNGQPYFPIVDKNMLGCEMVDTLISQQNIPIITHTYDPINFVTLKLFTKNTTTNTAPRLLSSVKIPMYDSEKPEILLRDKNIFVIYRLKQTILQYIVEGNKEEPNSLYIKGPVEIKSVKDIVL